MRDLIELYKFITGGEPVPLMEIMGNKVFCDDFKSRPELLYIYCIENKMKWEDVLGVSLDIFDDPNVQS